MVAGGASSRAVVAVVATGGTIANTPSGRLGIDRVVAELPELGQLADLRLHEVSRVSSSSLTFGELIRTAAAIDAALAQEPSPDGVVVTAGSNTSEEVAYFLNLVVSSPRPVVVTAAQRRRTTPSEDASRNLVDAVLVAGSPAAAGKGVLLVANELIHPAREVTKRVASRVDAWQSPDTGVLGMISGGRPVFYRAPVRRHTTSSEFRLNAIASTHRLPRVEILYSHVDAGPGIVTAAVEHAGADGLVVAAFATGAVHASQRRELEGAARRGVPVVVANRGGSGRIAPPPEPFVGADNLSPQKAMVLLTLALTVTRGRAELQRIFDEY